MSSPVQVKRTQTVNNDPRPPKKPKLSDDNEEGELKEETPPAVPCVTTKKDVLTLPSTDIEVYLRDTPSFTISPAPIKDRIPRFKLCRSYLTVEHIWLNQIPPHQNPTGNGPRNLWFLRPCEHPAAPRNPGMSGLVLGFNEQEGTPTKDGPWSVFRQLNKKMWLYLGEYDNVYVEPLSKEQFCAQSEAVSCQLNVRLRQRC